MMHGLDLDGHVVHKPQLSTLAESPSQVTSDTTSTASDSASVTQSLKVGPRVNSLKRSPLGRSVVTALEAELDQVQPRLLSIQQHVRPNPVHCFKTTCITVSDGSHSLCRPAGLLVCTSQLTNVEDFVLRMQNVESKYDFRLCPVHIVW